MGMDSMAVERAAAQHWRNLLRQRNVLLLCVAYMPNCATFYFCITWLPTYLMKQHGFEKAELGLVAALPLFLSTGTQLHFAAESAAANIARGSAKRSAPGRRGAVTGRKIALPPS